MDKLIEWKDNTNHKVTMLYGASGVGKTYLALDFAKSFYEQFIYFDLGEDSSVIDNILESDRKELEHNLDMYQELTIRNTDSKDVNSEAVPSNKKEEVLLIFDNTQLFFEKSDNEIDSSIDIVSNKDKLKEVFELLNQSLKYHVLAISNEVMDVFMPSDKISNQILHPLDFEEFLYAIGHEWYIETIKIHYQTNSRLPVIVHNQLLKLFDTYLEIGGMPLAVNEYNNTETLYNISNQHKLIMNSYLYEISKKENLDGLKINQVFCSMDKQLLKENRKFKYSMIRKGATCGIYSSAIKYIQNSFYGLSCFKLDNIEIDAGCSEHIDYVHSLYNIKDKNMQNVKLYYFDVGLLNTTIKRSSTKLESVDINRNNNSNSLANNKLLHTNKRRALIENYIAITLASNGYPLIYWESNSLAKMEFIIMKDNVIIPIEVRSNDMTRSKNFSVFRNQYKNVNEQIKISTRNFEYNNRVKYVPIYAAFCI